MKSFLDFGKKLQEAKATYTIKDSEGNIKHAGTDKDIAYKTHKSLNAKEAGHKLYKNGVSCLAESDEAWAASEEKRREKEALARLSSKDQGTLAKVRDMLAKEKKPAKNEAVKQVRGDTGLQYEETELDEAHKINDKVEIIKGSSKGTTGHIGEIRHGAYKGAPKTYTVYHGEHGAVQVSKEHIRKLKEDISIDEASRAETGELFKGLVDKAHASSQAGNHTQAKRHLANAQTARYGILAKHMPKHQSSFDKYKELKHSYTNSDEPVREEVEELDELSNKLLNRYSKKAEKEAGKHFMAADRAQDRGNYDKAQTNMDKAEKRASGVYRAQSKIKEESLDEISKDTLTSYANKAFAQGNDLHYDLAHSKGDKATDAERQAIKDKISKRNSGVIKAAQKMNKESIDLEEAKHSLNDLEHATNSADDLSHDAEQASKRANSTSKNHKDHEENHSDADMAHDEAHEAHKKAHMYYTKVKPKPVYAKHHAEKAAYHLEQSKSHNRQAFDEAVDTVKRDEKGKVIAWSHEGDWEKMSTKKQGQGKAANLAGKALQKTKQLSKEEVELDEAGHVYDTKTGKIHSTHDTYKKAVNAMNKLNDTHPAYPGPGGLDNAKFGAKRVNEDLEDINESAWGRDKMSSLRQAHDRHMEKALAANKAGDDTAVKTHQRKMQMIQGKMQKLKQNEEVELGEECEILSELDKKTGWKRDKELEKNTFHTELHPNNRAYSNGKHKAFVHHRYDDHQGQTRGISVGGRAKLGWHATVTGPTKNGTIYRHHSVHGSSQDAEAAIKRHMDNLKEELDILSELDKKTLGNYVKKSHDQLMKHTSSVNFKGGRGDSDAFAYAHDPVAVRKTANRQKGMDQAINKLTKEEVEEFMQTEAYDQLDELSKNTLKSYVGKAVQSHGSNRVIANMAWDKSEEPGDLLDKLGHKALKDSKKRSIGIAKAVDKLTKEEVEELDEASIKLFMGMYQVWHKGKKVASYASKTDAQDHARSLKEEVEELDELSKDTLGSYVKKASDQSKRAAVSANQSKHTASDAMDSGNSRLHDLHANNYRYSKNLEKKRDAGVNKAVDKLTKEDSMLTYSEFMAQLSEGKADDLRDKLAADREARLNNYDYSKEKDNKKSSVQKVKGHSYGAGEEEGESDDDNTVKTAKPAAVKRGRGRPVGTKSGARV
jgi:hypothetical protein